MRDGHLPIEGHKGLYKEVSDIQGVEKAISFLKVSSRVEAKYNCCERWLKKGSKPG